MKVPLDTFSEETEAEMWPVKELFLSEQTSPQFPLFEGRGGVGTDPFSVVGSRENGWSCVRGGSG